MAAPGHHQRSQSPLFAALGTTYGAGDGSTSFGTPDVRGRALFGLDNLGGPAASRITSGVSGINAAALGDAGGDQRIGTHGHAATQAAHTCAGLAKNDNRQPGATKTPDHLSVNCPGFVGGSHFQIGWSRYEQDDEQILS